MYLHYPKRLLSVTEHFIWSPVRQWGMKSQNKRCRRFSTSVQWNPWCHRVAGVYRPFNLSQWVKLGTRSVLSAVCQHSHRSTFGLQESLWRNIHVIAADFCLCPKSHATHVFGVVLIERLLAAEMTHCVLKWPVETFTVALHTFRDCKSRFISPSAAPVLPWVVFLSVAAVVLVLNSASCTFHWMQI